METDQAYFERRADEARAAAAGASDARARQAHFEMAERYADLSAAIRTHEPDLDAGVKRAA